MANDSHDRAVELRPLSETTLELADRAEDIRGRNAFDTTGETIGEVEDLLVDPDERKVRFVKLVSGGFLGLGGTSSLIPVDAISKVEDDRVWVAADREHVERAPAYDPDVTLGRSEYEGLYRHYGYVPYWYVGYAVPR